MRWTSLALGVAALAIGLVGAASAQAPKAPAAATPGATTPEHGGELECRNCHQGKHQGVIRMYLGMGGRGTPLIPSHMMQVRVQCVACHIQPKEDAATARIVGQTFRPTEQACINCHGEKYRGMLKRWVDTLATMHEIVTRKLTAARTALGGAERAPKHARARELADSAEHNAQFVALGRGVHNVFYAADLLKVANGWLDEAMPLLGKTPVKVDDTLVRGGYCGVLCHQQAGVKLPETVTFGKQKVPHARHVTEFGAVCTACHSAEVHKAVTAKPATCTGCHHSAQNERCESCHRAQSAFYRGEVKTDLAKIEPNSMAQVVACTGCHDLSRKHSRQAVGDKCLGCHDAAFGEFAKEWTVGADKTVAAAAAAVKQAEAAVASARRSGHASPAAEISLKQARDALALVRQARAAHNPSGADALLAVAQRKAEEARGAARP